jgi:hypothetical protein
MAAPMKDDVDAIDDLVEASFCTSVEHFFTPAARDLLGRYLGSYCDQLIITPAEMVHSAKYQKRLHDAGRIMMNVIDKVATIQARRKGIDAAQRVRDLGALVSLAGRKVWDDDKERPLPTVKPEAFADAVDRMPPKDREYTAFRQLTDLLAAYKVWKDKVGILAKMLAANQGRTAAPVIEAILAETIRSEPAIDQLLGMPETLEDRCNDLIDLWKGTWQARDTASPVVVDLNALIASGAALSLKTSIEFCLMRSLAGKMPLRSAEPELEIQAVIDLFRRMWLGQGVIGGTKALAMLERRQSRTITTETVTDLLRERKVVVDRLFYLMTLAQLAVGPTNRGTVKSFIDHYFGDRDFIPRVIAGQELPIPKLQTLTQLHRAIKTSWLGDAEKVTYGASVAAAHAELLKRSRLFEQIDKKGGSPSQKLLTILDLCRKNTFIDGDSMETVRVQVQGYLNDPQFMPDYLGSTSGEERDRKISLLTRTVNAIGLIWEP